MTIKLKLGKVQKSKPIEVLEVRTEDYKLLTLTFMADYDRVKMIPLGTITLIDLYGNDITFATKRLIHSIPVCATLVKEKGQVYWIAHPCKITNGVKVLTVLKNNKEDVAWGLCWRYDNLFSV